MQEKICRRGHARALLHSKIGKSILHRNKCIAQDIGDDICTEDAMQEMTGHAGEDM